MSGWGCELKVVEVVNQMKEKKKIDFAVEYSSLLYNKLLKITKTCRNPSRYLYQS